MIKTILFDNNGVLTYSDLERTIDNFAQYFKVSREEIFDIFEEAAKKMDGGEITTNQWYQEIADGLGKTYNQDELHEIHLNSYEPKQGMRELLESLKKSYEIAILTNFGDAFNEVNEKFWHYEEIFEPEKIFVSAYLKMLKPNKDFYLYALDKLEKNPEEVIFVDDRESNLEPAKELGMKTVHFQNVEQAKNEIYSLLNLEMKVN